MENRTESSSLINKNILDRSRNLTNPKTLILFTICLLIWVPVVIYAFVCGDSSRLSPTHENYNAKMNAAKIFTAIGYMLLTGFFSALLLVTLRWIPNISYVTFISIWIQVIGAIMAVHNYVNFSSVQTLIGSAIGVIVMHVIISAEWFHLPEKLIKESCKVMMAIPSTMLFSAVFYLISLLIAAVTLTAFVFLLPLPGTTPMFLMFLCFVTGFWLTLVSLSIGSLTLFATFSAWYWIDNKQQISFRTVLRSCKIILRYHVGTAAFGTSIFGVLKVFYTLIGHAFSYGKEHGVSLNYSVYIIYNIFDSIAFRFTMIGSLTRCATNGSSFLDPLTSVVTYCEERPRRTLLAVKVMEYVLIFVLVIILSLMMISIYVLISQNPDYTIAKDQYFLISVLLGSLFFIWSIVTTFSVAYYSLLLCFFEDLDQNDDSENRPYSMSAELRSAVNHDGPPACIRGCIPHILDKEE